MRTFDVAIIGGGLVGGAIAFELAQRELRVVVFDRQQPGREASWAAAGMLSPAPDSPDAAPLAPLAKASLELYPKFVAEIEASSGKSTGFRHEGTLQVFPTPQGEKERDSLVDEHRGLGLRTEAISLHAAIKMEPRLGPAVSAAAWLPEEATVEPRSLIDAVIAAAARAGVKFHEHTEVTSVLVEGTRCGGILAGGEKIFAHHVIAAAGCYTGGIDWLGRYAPTRPVRGQMVAMRLSGDPQHRVIRSDRGYLVPRSDGKIVAGSTLENAGFERYVTPSGLREILDAALELVPSLADAEVLETWAGLRPDTPDHLPALGPIDKEGLLIATGHYRNGILLAPITAKLITEWLVSGRTSMDVSRFSPLRFVEETRRASR